jgi:hypothetical protein
VVTAVTGNLTQRAVSGEVELGEFAVDVDRHSDPGVVLHRLDLIPRQAQVATARVATIVTEVKW